MKILFCVALCCVLVHHIKAPAPPTTIKVGVIEDMHDDQLKVVEQATAFLKQFDNEQPDIIVLPEYGLTGLYNTTFAVKIDKDNISSSPELKDLQELAISKKVILVANLLEKDDDDLYSTTVVLDGTNTTATELLAKYQKINLRKDDEKSLKSASEITTFMHKTYGTIGLMSGDDIAYENPARTLLEKKVTTILYTSSKKVMAPFDTTVSLYAGFAKAHGVNLIVSSYNDVKNHTSGSGIFTPCGQKWAFLGNGSKSTVSTINIAPSDKDCATTTIKKRLLSTLGETGSFNDIPLYNLDGLKTELIKTNISNTPICDGSFCCNFTVISASWVNDEHYRTVISKENKICGVVACKDTNDDNVNTACGRIDNKNPLKTKLNITIVTTEDEDLFEPYILHSDLTPKDDLKTVTFGRVKDNKGTAFNTTAGLTDIVAIGIVAAKSGADSLHIIATNLIVMSLFLKYLLK